MVAFEVIVLAFVLSAVPRFKVIASSMVKPVFNVLVVVIVESDNVIVELAGTFQSTAVADIVRLSNVAVMDDVTLSVHVPQPDNVNTSSAACVFHVRVAASV